MKPTIALSLLAALLVRGHRRAQTSRVPRQRAAHRLQPALGPASAAAEVAARPVRARSSRRRWSARTGRSTSGSVIRTRATPSTSSPPSIPTARSSGGTHGLVGHADAVLARARSRRPHLRRARRTATSTRSTPTARSRGASAAASPVQQHPVVGPDGTVYIGMDGALHAITPDGAVRWTATLGTTTLPGGPALSPDGQTIYAFGHDVSGPVGDPVRVPPDGTLRWQYSGFYGYYPALSPPTVAADGTVIVVSGQVVAVGPDGVQRWRYSPSASYYNSLRLGGGEPGGRGRLRLRLVPRQAERQRRDGVADRVPRRRVPERAGEHVFGAADRRGRQHLPRPRHRQALDAAVGKGRSARTRPGQLAVGVPARRGRVHVVARRSPPTARSTSAAWTGSCTRIGDAAPPPPNGLRSISFNPASIACRGGPGRVVTCSSPPRRRGHGDAGLRRSRAWSRCRRRSRSPRGPPPRPSRPRPASSPADHDGGLRHVRGHDEVRSDHGDAAAGRQRRPAVEAPRSEPVAPLAPARRGLGRRGRGLSSAGERPLPARLPARAGSAHAGLVHAPGRAATWPSTAPCARSTPCSSCAARPSWRWR